MIQLQPYLQLEKFSYNSICNWKNLTYNWKKLVATILVTGKSVATIIATEKNSVATSLVTGKNTHL
jgi:hypothetical protein